MCRVHWPLSETVKSQNCEKFFHHVGADVFRLYAFSKSEVFILPALGSTRWMKSSYLAIFRRSSDPSNVRGLCIGYGCGRFFVGIRDILCIIKVCSIY
jgi:hypothetical protein